MTAQGFNPGYAATHTRTLKGCKTAILPRHPRRGFGLIGLAGLIAILGIMCAAVSIASMRSATGSIRGVQRLQIQAAAEGAAVLIAAGDAPTSGTLQIGDCLVKITPDTATENAEQTTATTTASKLTVSLTAADRAVLTRRYAVIPAAPGDAITLEPLP